MPTAEVGSFQEDPGTMEFRPELAPFQSKRFARLAGKPTLSWTLRWHLLGSDVAPEAGCIPVRKDFPG